MENSIKLRQMLYKLTDLYNILVVTNPQNQQIKIFIISNWIPIQNNLPSNRLIGKEITALLEDNSLQVMIGTDLIYNELTQVVRQTINTKIENIPSIQYEFSSHFLWEQLTKSF